MSNEIKINNTKVLFGLEARKALFAGVEIAAKAVGTTLGPKGKTVLIQNNDETPVATKDGVSVAKAVKLKDPVARMGAKLVTEAASRTNEMAGDGTTTATVLTHALVEKGLRLLEAGYQPSSLSRGLTLSTQKILAQLKKSSVQIATQEQVEHVASISANNDKMIGKLIAEAVTKVGKHGIVSIEDAKGTETSTHFVEGLMFDRGYLSPYFVNNNDKMHVLYNDCLVLVTDKKLTAAKEVVPSLDYAARNRIPLLIVAEDVEGEALQTLVINKVKSQLAVAAVKAPGFGRNKLDQLNDICILVGAKLISSSAGTSLDKPQECFGKCRKFLVTSKSTTIVGTGSTQAEINKRILELQTQMGDVTLSQEERSKLSERVAKLSSGVAVIRVGGATEVEMVERRYRVEDALNATRSALDGGILPGGGMALYSAVKAVNTEQFNNCLDQEEQLGAKLVFEAALAPLRKNILNSNTSPDVVLEKLSQENKLNVGYNVAAGQYVDMIEQGIIDPCKVTVAALENASSVASTFLALDVVICEDA